MKLTRKTKYFAEIERLMGIGYEPKHIIKMTGIPSTTVYRVVEKMQVESRIDFKKTMSHNFLWMYQQNLENYSRTIQECNEEIAYMKKKYDQLEFDNRVELKACAPDRVVARATLLSNLTAIQSSRTNELVKLTAQRDKASEGKAKVFNQGTVVYAMDEWVQKTTPTMGELPRVKELDELNPTPKQLNKEPLSADDQAVLDEMNKDE